MNAGTNNSIDQINFDTFIGAWVLPNEEIPTHIIWDSDFEFSHINLIIPEDLEFIEAINIKNFSGNRCKVINKEDIRKINVENSYPNFIGFVFSYSNHKIKELKLFRDIIFQFNNNNQTVKEIILTAKIFRPKLRSKANHAIIEFRDKIANYSIDLDLTCEGFGYTLISFDLEMKGIGIPIHQNVYETVCERLVERYKKIFTLDKVEIELDKSLKKYNGINEKTIRGFCKILEDLTNKSIAEKARIFDTLEKNNIDDILVMDFIVESIKELRHRYMYENISINTTTAEIPNEKINDLIHSGKLIIKYKDLKDNPYEPLEIKLEIKDRRTKESNANIKFKIKVINIDDKTFGDIEKMKRD